MVHDLFHCQQQPQSAIWNPFKSKHWGQLAILHICHFPFTKKNSNAWCCVCSPAIFAPCLSIAKLFRIVGTYRQMGCTSVRWLVLGCFIKVTRARRYTAVTFSLQVSLRFAGNLDGHFLMHMFPFQSLTCHIASRWHNSHVFIQFVRFREWQSPSIRTLVYRAGFGGTLVLECRKHLDSTVHITGNPRRTPFQKSDGS